MKIYVHTGHGHWVGSCIVAVADDYIEASKMIRDELDVNGLKNEPLHIQIFGPSKPRIIHVDTGEY